MITVLSGQSVSGSGTGSASPAHFNNTITSGNAIIVSIVTNDTSGIGVATVTDSESNAYHRQGTLYSFGTGTIELWAAFNVASTGSANQTVSATTTNSGDALFIIGQEISGIGNYFDVQGSIYTTSGASLTTPNINARGASEILIGIGAQTNSTRPFTVGTGYTMINSITSGSGGIALEYKIISSTGSYNAAMSLDLAEKWGLSLFALSANSISAPAKANGFFPFM